jgi:hypothetical protein
MRIVPLGVVVLTSVAVPALAQQQSAKQKAAQLFEDGRKLMQSKDYAAACPKLEESFNADPAVGTTLNVALCYEKLGKLATSYGWYERAANSATAAKQDARASFAHEQMTRLDGMAAHVVVHVAQTVPGLAITRNGTATTAGAPERIDAGSYDFAASADGYNPWQSKVEIVDGKTTTVEVPALEPIAKPEPKPLMPAPNAKARKTRLIIAYSVGGAGVAFLLTGLGFGLAAQSAWNDARSQCPQGSTMCSPDAKSAGDTAGTRADVSTVMTTIGVAAIGAGVVLLLTAPKKASAAPPPEETTFVPTVSKDGVGFAVTGRF